jgi:uncharacterized protein (DUF885 family)
MKPVRRHLLCVSGLTLLATANALGAAAAQPPTTSAASTSPSFDTFLEELSADWMRADPVGATISQYFSGTEQDRLDRLLTARDFEYRLPLLDEPRAQYVARARRGLEQLRGYPLDSLTPAQRVSASSLAWQLNQAIRLASIEDHRYVFDQFSGLQVSLVNFLSQVHPIRNVRDVENYLVRLSQVSSVIDQGIVEARSRAQKGIIPPRFILQAAEKALDRFLSDGAPNNVLVTSLRDRTAMLRDYAPPQRAAALRRAEQIVHDSVIPAFQRVRSLLEKQASLATDDAGIGHLPQGPAVYAVLLQTNTTTDMTPEQIHALGLREVAHIEGQMDGLLRQLGYTQGSVKERYAALERSVQPPATPDPRPALMEQHEHILRDAEMRARALFDLRPRAAVRILREPPFTEQTAAAHYVAPAPDGSLPGTVRIPLPGPTYEILEMRTLTYHEGVPGHHFQIALQREMTGLPMFRRKQIFLGLSAFTEGWALYAEHMVAEQGWYEGDPKGHLGQLEDELFRARRLVVDTGLHAMHWSRQQAIDYGIRPAEVDRYAVIPGQACSYMIGELTLLAQREKAQKALGARFSLQQFHDWVLGTGSLPLPVLEQVIEQKIESAAKQGS